MLAGNANRIYVDEKRDGVVAPNAAGTLGAMEVARIDQPDLGIVPPQVVEVAETTKEPEVASGVDPRNRTIPRPRNGRIEPAYATSEAMEGRGAPTGVLLPAVCRVLVRHRPASRRRPCEH